jgi:hypothetical protein
VLLRHRPLSAAGLLTTIYRTLLELTGLRVQRFVLLNATAATPTQMCSRFHGFRVSTTEKGQHRWEVDYFR